MDTQTIAGASTPGQAAGLWWANALKSPKFDNGANDLANLMAQVLAKDLADGQAQEETALDTFARLIGEHVDQELANPNAWRQQVILSVDYHPDMALSDCAEQAGLKNIDMGFPWKTTMWITPDEVSVSAGYGAASEVVWRKTS